MKKLQSLSFLKKFYSIAQQQNHVDILYSNQKNIHFNLAIEEYLFDHCDLQVPTLFLWQNDKTVVIGRHQNPWKECHIQQMEKDSCLLARRRTGGGAVYQDLGNSCFSFLNPVAKNKQPLDCKEDNNKILIQALQQLNIMAEVKGRNDIVVDNKKVSGSAYKINIGDKDGKKRKALHHGTMLLNVDMNGVEKYLNPAKVKLQSKGVDSVKSRILNLCQINSSLNHQIFCLAIEKAFYNHYSQFKPTIKHLTLNELEQNQIINRIYKELISWDWIYGATPKFSNELENRFDWGIIDITCEVQQNKIVKAKVFSDCLYDTYIDNMNSILNTGSITYDSQGMKLFIEKLKVISNNDDTLQQYSKELLIWLLQVI